jgi:hypothetical protein
MKALTWHGKQDVRVETVPDPGHPAAWRHRRSRDRDGGLRLGSPHL